VLEPYLGRSEFENHGQRVVEGQRLVQAASDIMLGWVRTTEWIDGVKPRFYIRQLWDGKGSAPVDVLDPDATPAATASYVAGPSRVLTHAQATRSRSAAISAPGTRLTGPCAPLPTAMPIRTNAITRLSGMPLTSARISVRPGL